MNMLVTYNTEFERYEWLLHKIDGPAIEGALGDKFWCQHGQLHRDNGPAIERADGTKAWYRQNVLHRIDGPAIERADGTKAWSIKGDQLTEDEFNSIPTLI